MTGDDSDVKMAATENSATPKCASKPKKRPTDSAIKEAKKKTNQLKRRMVFMVAVLTKQLTMKQKNLNNKKNGKMKFEMLSWLM